MSVACGPGFPLQVLAFPAATPLRAPGFTLQSLTRPTRNSAKYIFHVVTFFYRASLMVTRNDVFLNSL